MSLPPSIAHYRITAKLGEGGMGEVYRATDTKLGRDVAIKVIPDAFAQDAGRMARFAREAQVLAALNHPNIAAIYGVEGSALVMELVDGPTLEERIARGPMPVEEALAVAQQIAEAVEYAHERGVIHRDLKPANVKLTPKGRVKVLDFGLAKLTEQSEGGVTALTQTMAIVGTPGYLAPEQLKGKPADARSDIFAFGCVLYELLSGRRAFAGDTLAASLAATAMVEPKAIEGVPKELERLALRCLRKDPERRIQHMDDVSVALEDLKQDLESLRDPHRRPGDIGAAAPLPEDAPISTAQLFPLRWIAAVALVALVLIGAWWAIHRAAAGLSSPAGLSQTTIVLPPGLEMAAGDGAYPLALSPDGARIAYVAGDEGRNHLYVREMSELAPKPVSGATGVAHPFFSPDGQWIAFFAGGALQKVAVAGGAPLRICSVSSLSRGGSWGPGDTVVFALLGAGLFRVNAAGGAPQPLAGSGVAAWPEILPDGKTVLFTTGSLVAHTAIATMPLEGGKKRIVGELNGAPLEGPPVLGAGDIHQARILPGGYLIYGQSPGIVRAAPFDLKSKTLSGSPVSMVDSVERARNDGGVYFAVSRTGMLVYAPTGDRHRLVWVDRNGAETPVTSDREAFRDPRISPDGKRVAVAINDETRRSDIWIYDTERGTKNRLTTTRHNLAPVWTPDGTHITFSGGGIAELPANGGGSRDLLLPPDKVRYPTSWSSDGRDLLFQLAGPTGMDLGVFTRRSEPRLLLERPFNDYDGVFSPDGKWVAYTSDESGRAQVYVGRYPDVVEKVAVSSDGGADPRWSRDGRELFYRQGDALMAAYVDAGRGLRVEKPRPLFAGHYSGASHDSQFDVSPDGRRFVMVKSDEASTLRQITVVQNWSEELRRRVPAGSK